MNKISLFLGVIVMALSAMVSLNAQTATPDVFKDWDCSAVTFDGYCTRTLARGDTGWAFAQKLFNEPTLWRKFAEDNPDNSKVIERNGNSILQWREGDTIRIRRTDLKALGVAPDPPIIKPVVVELVTSDTLVWLFWYVLIPFFALCALIFGIALVALLAVNMQRELRLKDNPLDPNASGMPMGGRWRWRLGILPSINTVSQTLTRIGTQQAGMARAAIGNLERIIHVPLTVPEGTTIPTEFRNGVQPSRPLHSHVYLGVFYNGAGQIVNVVGAFAYCQNGMLFNQMSRTELAAFVANATWGTPRVVRSGRGAPNPFRWEAVLNFMQSMTVDAPAPAVVEAQATAVPAATEAPAENKTAAPDTAKTTVPATQEISYGKDGMSISGGKINLQGGAVLDLTGGGTVKVTPTGSVFVDEIPFNHTDDISEATH